MGVKPRSGMASGRRCPTTRADGSALHSPDANASGDRVEYTESQSQSDVLEDVC